jgi:urease accessory protein UreF
MIAVLVGETEEGKDGDDDEVRWKGDLIEVVRSWAELERSDAEVCKGIRANASSCSRQREQRAVSTRTGQGSHKTEE